MRRSGFTLLELLVVMAMLVLLMGVATVSVSRARNSAKVSKATQEIKEITNAILAYEQFAPGRTLKNVVQAGWSDCTEGSMTMILGGMTGDSGEKIPVLYNAALTGGRMLDPWGVTYQYKIEKSAELGNGEGTTDTTEFFTGVAMPNYNRLSPKERLP